MRVAQRPDETCRGLSATLFCPEDFWPEDFCPEDFYPKEPDILVELMIEQWSQPDGSIRYLWSAWEQGKRIGIGEGASTAEAAEAAGRQWCIQATARPPGRITRL